MENRKLNGFNDGLHVSSGIGGGQSASEMMAEMNEKPFKLPYHWCVKVGVGFTPEEVYAWAPKHGTWWNADTNNRKGGVGYINRYGLWSAEKEMRDTEITLEQFIEFVYPQTLPVKEVSTSEMYAPYGLSSLLKMKGFDVPCFYCYYEDGVTGFDSEEVDYNDNVFKNRISRPMYQKVLDWLRIKHNIFIYPNRTVGAEGIWYYFTVEHNTTIRVEGSFVYYDALYKAVAEALTLIHKKK